MDKINSQAENTTEEKKDKKAPEIPVKLNEQIETPPSKKEIYWIKKGGGVHRLKDGRLIKKGQKFKATEEDIPETFRDVLVPLEPLPSKSEKIQSISEFEIVQAGTSGGWFNIINKATGKPLNAKGMRKEKALEVLQDLS